MGCPPVIWSLKKLTIRLIAAKATPLSARLNEAKLSKRNCAGTSIIERR